MPRLVELSCQGIVRFLTAFPNQIRISGFMVGVGSVIFSSRDLILHVVSAFEEYDRFQVIVGGGCTPAQLPGPANITIGLFTDFFPEEITIGYINVCMDEIQTSIVEGTTSHLESLTLYAFPLLLPAGEYQFYITDSTGNGKEFINL